MGIYHYLGENIMVSTISTSMVDLSSSRYAARVCDAVREVLLALTLRERWGVAASTVGQLCFPVLVELLLAYVNPLPSLSRFTLIISGEYLDLDQLI